MAENATPKMPSMNWGQLLEKGRAELEKELPHVDPLQVKQIPVASVLQSLPPELFMPPNRGLGILNTPPSAIPNPYQHMAAMMAIQDAPMSKVMDANRNNMAIIELQNALANNQLIRTGRIRELAGQAADDKVLGPNKARALQAAQKAGITTNEWQATHGAEDAQSQLDYRNVTRDATKFNTELQQYKLAEAKRLAAMEPTGTIPLDAKERFDQGITVNDKLSSYIKLGVSAVNEEAGIGGKIDDYDTKIIRTVVPQASEFYWEARSRGFSSDEALIRAQQFADKQIRERMAIKAYTSSDIRAMPITSILNRDTLVDTTTELGKQKRDMVLQNEKDYTVKGVVKEDASRTLPDGSPAKAHFLVYQNKKDPNDISAFPVGTNVYDEYAKREAKIKAGKLGQMKDISQKVMRAADLAPTVEELNKMTGRRDAGAGYVPGEEFNY